MGNPTFATGCYYHIYNRGVEKREIFIDWRDYNRFLQTLDYYRIFPLQMKLSDFKRGAIKLKKIENQKEIIRIFCYCLMPNHFHFLVQQLEENGISRFLRLLSDSYTKYFNTKYKRVGPLFQGTFKARLIETDEYLLQLSKYIHRNPFPHSKRAFRSYPHSSYGYFLSGAEHPFCDTKFILSYFSTTYQDLGYQVFVERAEMDDPLLFNMLIDKEN